MHRIERPLFLERLLRLSVLREAVSSAERRAYFKKLRELRKQIGSLDKANQKELLKLIQTTRRSIITSIAEAKDFKAYHLSELTAEFQSVMGQFGTRYGAMMNELIPIHSELGAQLTTVPIAEYGAASIGGFTGVSPAVTEAAATMSAELVSGLTTEALKNINTQVRLVSMGVKSQHDAIGAIGRNLTDKSVFKTIATRAETIMRTETGRIRSQAGLADMQFVKDVEVPGLKIMKQWIWSGIGREEHAELDGVTIGIDDNFTDGYGNSALMPRMFGEPESDINCGCDAILVAIEEGEV